jgi:hypothetical protein
VVVNCGRRIGLLFAAIQLVSCTAHAPHRLSSTRDASIEVGGDQLKSGRGRIDVASHSVEIHPSFSLAFIEFDDQGRLWNKEQVDSVDRLLASEARRTDNDGVVVIFFAHGWEHDAAVCDAFVACFRAYLAQIAAEARAGVSLAGGGAWSPRVVGIYAGWRGRAVEIPILRNLTFWSRKHVAERIGSGELIEVLVHLDQFVRSENAGGRPRAALDIIGHSFGGTMVYAALANVLKARLVEALHRRGKVPVDENLVDGFGNLVVLVNPAFEASAYAPLEDLVAAMGPFSRSQTPLLVIVGSETDFPNRTWFRLGRSLDVLLQRTGPRSERRLLTTSIGNYEPYLTHRLEAVSRSKGGAPRARVSNCICQLPLAEISADEARWLGAFLLKRGDADLPDAGAACEAGLTLGSARLTCRPGVTLNRPIWSVRASDDVVHGHREFFTRPLIDFLRYVVLDALSKSARMSSRHKESRD